MTRLDDSTSAAQSSMLQGPSNYDSLRAQAPRSRFAVGLTFAFLIVAGFQIFNHVVWLDEWQSWLIARDSHSLGELFRNLHYETHPPLWHLCLYAITRFTTDIRYMQGLHLALATAAVFVAARWSPFTRLQTVLFAFGYFVFYEYCAISRGYVLGLLLTLIAVKMLRRGARRIGFYLVVALLMQSEPYGIVLGAGLLLSAMAMLLWDWRLGEKPSARERRAIAAGLAIAVVSGGLAFIATVPPWDSTYVTHDKEFDALKTLHCVLRTFVNVPAFDTPHFWNKSFFDASYGSTRLLQGGLSAVILMVLVCVFLSRPVALVMLAVGIVGTLTALFISIDEEFRHAGHMFVAFVAAGWIAEETRARVWKSTIAVDSMRRKLFTGALALQMIPSAWAFWCERLHPFSGSRQAAAFVRDRFPADMPVVVFFDLAGPAFSGYLGRPVFYTSRQRFGTFLIWDGIRIRFRNPFPEIRRLQKKTGRDLIVLMPANVPQFLLPIGPEAPKLILQTTVTESINWVDNYGIYVAPYGQTNSSMTLPATRP